MNSRLRFLSLISILLVSGFVVRAGAQDSNGVYSKVDEAPIPVKTPPPKYPESLRRDGISGVVAVMVVIDESGAVAEATVSKSSNVAFERPSLDALKGWRFHPGKVAGNAVKTRVTVPMRFSVQD